MEKVDQFFLYNVRVGLRYHGLVDALRHQFTYFQSGCEGVPPEEELEIDHERRAWCAFLVSYLAICVSAQTLTMILMEQLEGRYSRERELIVQSLLTSSSAQELARLKRRISRRKRGRRLHWVRPGRTSAWWDNIRNGVALETEYKENFRMNKKNFQSLCEKLLPYIARESTIMREAVDVETQVALTLSYLSDEGRMRKTANSFGLSRSAVSVIVRQVCSAISVHLGPEYIGLPKTEESVHQLISKF